MPNYPGLGLGYGLATIGAGITKGILKAKENQFNLQMLGLKLAQERKLHDEELAIKKQQLEETQKNNGIKMHADAWKTALDIWDKTGDQELANQAFGGMLPEGSEFDELTFPENRPLKKEDMTSVVLTDPATKKRLKFSGSVNDIKTFQAAIESDPSQAENLLQASRKLNRLIYSEEDSKEYAPDEITKNNQVIAQLRAIPEVQRTPQQNEELALRESKNKPQAEKLPSLGNIVETTISRKFQDPAYLTDPVKHGEALKWLDSPQGRAELQRTRDELTPVSAAFVQTGAGIVPGITRGKGAGTLGQPTEFGKAIPSNDVEELAAMKTTYTRLQDVLEKSKGLKGKFGPITGRWNKLKVKFVNEGATQGVINELNSLITIAYSLSGKQISYREMELLQQAMLPRLEQPYENFEATLNFAKDWMAKSHDDRLSYYTSSGYQTDIKTLKKTEGKVGKKVGGWSWEEKK